MSRLRHCHGSSFPRTKKAWKLVAAKTRMPVTSDVIRALAAPGQAPAAPARTSTTWSRARTLKPQSHLDSDNQEPPPKATQPFLPAFSPHESGPSARHAVSPGLAPERAALILASGQCYPHSAPRNGHLASAIYPRPIFWWCKCHLARNAALADRGGRGHKT